MGRKNNFLCFIHMQKFLFLISSFIVIFLFFLSCAKEVAPSGGPKDVDPPEVMWVSPQDKTVRFQETKIIIRFNEFITLKNPATNIYFVPFLEEEVQYKIKGKKLIVKLPRTMKDSLTYSLMLSSAVADFTEGNMLDKFRYTFTTASYMDSLSIQGRLTDAESGDPLEKVNVYLFPEAADSALLKKQFAWKTTTLPGGFFSFQHLPQGSYVIYALLETDNNHIYNSFEEKSGFYNETVQAKHTRIDDTTYTNSVVLEHPVMIFQERDTVLKISKAVRNRKGLQHIVFSMPVDSASVVTVDSLVADTVFSVLNKTKDTLSVWFVGQKADYASMEVSANGMVLDTISLTLKHAGRGGGGTGPDVYLKPVLGVQGLFDKERIHFGDTVSIVCNNPIGQILEDSIFVTEGNDTLLRQIVFDSENPMKFFVVFESRENGKYHIQFPDSCVIDVFGGSNDSLDFYVHFTDSAYYGHVVFELEEKIEGCHLIELYSVRSNQRYKQNYSEPQEVYRFERIIPGDYAISVVYDSNCNGKWDTGVFRLLKQPEKVLKLPGRAMVQSGWETEVIWSSER